MRYKLLQALCLILLSWQSWALSQLRISVDTNPVVMNESFELEILADARIAQNKINFEPVSKNFRVLGSSESNETRIFNGQTTRLTRIKTRLIPIKPGNFTIGPFVIDGVSSNQLPIEVVRRAQAANSQPRMVYIENQVSNNEIWLNQQFIYTSRLFINEATLLDSASLSQPELDNALIEQIGQDQEKNLLVNGMRYRVIERQYAITPQRSGQVEISPPLFSGEVLTRSRNSFFSQGRGKTIQRAGNSVSINVKPIPANYQGHWLPSSLVQLHDEISPLTEHKVGEPITRTITLSALGIHKELLPEIKINYPSSIKVYPDQAQTHTNYRDGQVISQRIESAAIVPNQAGEITLPAVSVTWWNTEMERVEQAQIPPRKINVAAAEITQTTAVQDPNVVVNEVTPAQVTEKVIYQAQPWQLNNLVVIISLLWLLTIAAWIWHVKQLNKRLIAPEKQPQTRETESEKVAWQKLAKAVKNEDTSGICQNLPNWAAALTNKPILNLHQVNALFANDELTAEINAMQAARYSSTPSQWQNKTLEKCLLKLREARLIKQHQKNNNNLAKLNP
ncbi:protein BatD [Catenovulum sp. SM1970]|uniref:BatD family protein n=1 Tax=Marinifaba aquimaris TaxID=2741323 RepID=UPI001572D07E|nr:BatD family protein [Marinifaba aquimaris]NTS77844.1 protein BatD [Marinifaba aquimaris]